MYDNIGRKIKNLAAIIAFIQAIIPITIGILMIISSMDSKDGSVVPGVLVMVIGSILAWISSWLLYGFGELIEKACDIEYYLRRNSHKHSYTSRISKLEKLRAQGLITEEEYKKAMLKIHDEV